MSQQHARPSHTETKAQHPTAQPTVGGINRLSPMNPWAFKALVGLYPLYMAKLRTSRFSRYAKTIREIRMIAREDPAMKILYKDVKAVCHVARLTLSSDKAALDYIKGALKPEWNTKVDGRPVHEIVREDFQRNVGDLS